MTKRPQELQVVLLAGGLGTRIRDVIPQCAKPLVEVGGRPFLLWQLEWLIDQGFHDVLLCVGHRADDFVSLLKDEVPVRMNIRYSREQIPMGTGGALRLAEPLIGTDPTVVQNGDTYCDFDLVAVIDEHRRSGAAATMVVTEVEDVSRFGSVQFGADMTITGFREKSVSSGKGFINAGTYVLSHDQVRRIPPGLALSLETDIFPQMCGHHFRAYPVTGTFIDIGTPESLLRAREFFTERAKRLETP